MFRASIHVAFEGAWVLASRSAQSHRLSVLRGFTRLPQARIFNSFGYKNVGITENIFH